LVKIERVSSRSGFSRLHVIFAVIAAAASFASAAHAQARAQATIEGPAFARKNTFGFLAAYSPDSSHILLGYAERRKLLNIGVSYNRRLISGRRVSWQYDAELLPVALESDPQTRVVIDQTAPVPATVVENEPTATMVTCAPIITNESFVISGVTYNQTITQTCYGRQWTVGEGISPIGMRWNFLTTHRIQPVIAAHGGYMYSTHAIPIINAGSFNFTFDFGAGFEIYRTRSRSIRAEYRYHHISNKNTAFQNPGIDSGLIQFSYCFGR
jgi:opacity protein-like surface antigen